MKRLGLLVLLLATAFAQAASEDDFLRPIGQPPKATPQRRQGGEAMPPLPLPATPLRRSEKKRPPSPATLIGKVVWGSFKDWKWDNGEVTRVYDWNMIPADCQQLVGASQKATGMECKVETVALNTFNAKPAEIPVLYFSGGRRLNFGDPERETLRKYLLAGGMVWFDSVVGSPYFYTSALGELQKMFPEASIKRVPLDHPIFHMIDDTIKVSVKNKADVPPVLDGLYIGCRLAAVVSPYGLGCGWDNANPYLIPEANYYDRQSAVVLGLNLAAYAMGYFRVGQAHAQADVYRAEDLVPNADPVIFAQVRTNGEWNTEPGAANNLLRFMNRNLAIKANYKNQVVDLAKDPVANLPFLYLTGITDFTFSADELKTLRQYLTDGGYLLINNSLGLTEFDQAVRREVARLLPTGELKRLPADHPLFREGPFKLGEVKYTLATRARFPDVKTAWLEGANVGDDLRVVYSRFDLAAGWQGDDHPLALAYLPGDALPLGANIFAYFMTH